MITNKHRYTNYVYLMDNPHSLGIANKQTEPPSSFIVYCSVHLLSLLYDDILSKKYPFCTICEYNIYFCTSKYIASTPGGEENMERIKKGTKTMYDGVILTTEEYKNYLHVIDEVHQLITETKHRQLRKNW